MQAKVANILRLSRFLIMEFAFPSKSWISEMILTSLWTNNPSLRNWKQNFCKILWGKQNCIMGNMKAADTSTVTITVTLDYAMHALLKTTINSSLEVIMVTYRKDYSNPLFTFQHWQLDNKINDKLGANIFETVCDNSQRANFYRSKLYQLIKCSLFANVSQY